jgi:hypothetical protein
VKVAQEMDGKVPRVLGRLRLGDLVEERILNGGQSRFLVEDDGRLRGVLTLRHVTVVPRDQQILRYVRVRAELGV